MRSRTCSVVFAVIFVTMGSLPLILKACNKDEISVIDVRSGKETDCIPCHPCPKGKELYPTCGSIINEQQKGSIYCRSCQPGFYSNHTDIYPCKKCQHCLRSQSVIKKCTNISDTSCDDKCGKGYYQEETSLDCQQCSCCCGDAKDKKIEKCVNDNKPDGHHCTSHTSQECCTTPTNTIGKQSGKQSSPSVGAIIGIAIGSAVVFTIVIIAIACYCCKKKKKKQGRVEEKENVSYHKEESGEQFSKPSGPSSDGEQASNGNLVGENGTHVVTVENSLSNEGYASCSSMPGTPKADKFRAKIIKETSKTSQSHPSQHPDNNSKQVPVAIERQLSSGSQKSNSSDIEKAVSKFGRSASVSSVKEFARRMSDLRQSSVEYKERLVPDEGPEDVQLPENQTFKLCDIDFDVRERICKMLDNPPADAVGDAKRLAAAYKMDKLDIANIMKKSSPSEEVLGFIKAKYPSETVYKFCQVLHRRSLQRNDIGVELCDYLHKIDKKAGSLNNTNKFYV